jgi:hypothetical protein
MLMRVASLGRDFGGIRVSGADWPIILVDFPEKGVHDETLRSVLGHLEAIMTEAVRSREKLFFVTDISRMRQLSPASQRQLTAAWMKRADALCRAAGVGGATVTPSPLLRGIITALYWLHPPPTPSFSVATRHDAMLKGIEMLQAAKVPLSPRLASYRDNMSKRQVV